MTRSLWPPGQDTVRVAVAPGREVTLTNLRKPFWPEEGITKGDLLQHYATIAPALLPHIKDRPMVMKRYPHGAHGEFFFMKRAPSPRPPWIETCAIDHGDEKVIDFPLIQDLAALLWVINLGCIDLNPWYARRDDVDRPDFLHFDSIPWSGAGFDRVREAALVIGRPWTRSTCRATRRPPARRGSTCTSRSSAAPCRRTSGPSRRPSAARWPRGTRPAHRRVPGCGAAAGRVLVDYNQNAWGQTLASVYSVRPGRARPVSMPVTWDEVERGIAIEDFRIDNATERVARVGDLWAPSSPSAVACACRWRRARRRRDTSDLVARASPIVHPPAWSGQTCHSRSC